MAFSNVSLEQQVFLKRPQAQREHYTVGEILRLRTIITQPTIKQILDWSQGALALRRNQGT